MRVIRVLPAAAVLLAAAALPLRQNPEEAGVRAALEHYLAGHATGEGAHFAAAFHPKANLYFIREGQYAELTSAEYISRAAGRPAADEAQRRRRIASIDIAGTAAQAKIVLEYPAVTFTDYMSLLKIGGEWKIVAKTYHAERK